MPSTTSKSKPTEDVHIELAELNRDGHSVHRILAEVLTMARQALLSIASEDLCAATYQFGAEQGQVTSQRPLSRKLLREIKQGMSETLAQFSPSSESDELRFIVNGHSEQRYHFDDRNGRLHHRIVMPIAMQEETVALLYLASFNPGLDPRQSRFVRQFSRFLSRSLRHLWYLNSRQREQFELLVLHVIDGVLLCDARKRIRFINPSAQKLLGLKSDGRWLKKPVTDLNVDFIAKLLDEAMESGLHELNKVVTVASKRKKLIGVHVVLLKNARNTDLGWMFVLRDVTLNWQNDQMRSALSMASHEIKTPLNSILGTVDLLLENDLGDLNREQRHCLDVIKDDIHRLQRLISDLLDLSKFDEGIQFLDRRNQIALGLMINKVIDSFSSYAKTKNITIENRIPRTIPTFKGNRDRLQQVIVNLVENSIKYSNPGGLVIIEAEIMESTLQFRIQDQGPGIPGDQLERVFERFVQLDNHPEPGKHGYGLGLSIAKQIIEGCGGKIWVESQLGKGSTFFFSIPV